MENAFSENKMGTMPVNRLLLTMAVPMVISMLVQALYNVVDSIFVSQISENALTAVSLAFPIQSLMIAVGAGTGVGINAMLSKSLGERNYEQANKTANNGVFLILVSFAIFLVFGLFFTGMFYQSQTDDAEIFGYGVDYLSCVCVASLGLFGQITFERLLQSTGKTVYAMFTQAIGAIINIGLDAYFIFVLDMKVFGAALATVIAQTIAMIGAIILNVTKNDEIKLQLRGFRPDGNTILRIYAIGVPSMIMQAIGSVMTYCMNLILMGFSSTATAVFGVYFRLQSIVCMPIFGLNNGMVPIIAYNYGAQKRERITKTIRLSIIYAVVFMLFGLLVFQIFPEHLLMMFKASESMLFLGGYALRICSLSFVLAGFCIVAGSVFQAFGKSVLSMLVSIARQVVVLIPAAFLLAQTGEVNAVWWAFPIAELSSFLFSLIFLKYIYSRIIDRIPPSEEASEA